MSKRSDSDPVAVISTMRRVRMLLPVVGLSMIAVIWFFAGFEDSFRLFIVAMFLVVIALQFVIMSLYIRRLDKRVAS